MITSRISSTAETTLPPEVQTALGVSAGDDLAYEIKGREVVITRAGQPPVDDPFAVFDEWASDADARAYAGL